MLSPLVIAHRGDSSRQLENSLAAVRLALAVPADMIEVDIRKSRDNGLYVMHDRRTGRTAEPNIDIERSASGRVNGIRLRNGEAVPSLDDLLDLVAGALSLNLEIKSAGAGELTARRLQASGYRGPVLLSSFKDREVREARDAMPGLATAVIFDVFTKGMIGAYRAHGHTVISLRKTTADERLIAACHEQGIAVYVWTVDEAEEMKRFIAWGADGIYSNNPGLLKTIVENEKR